MKLSGSNQPIYDARQLGAGRMTLLGFQHLFAMFGATILVPVITGLSVSATLLFAGLGTLIFHFCSKFKVPAFLGSSLPLTNLFQRLSCYEWGNHSDWKSTQTKLLQMALLGID